MKNKICLIMIFAMLFVCAFAVAVSAEETSIPEWPSEVTILDGMSDKSVFGADGTVGATSRVLMSDGKAYPAYYICKNSSTLGFDFSNLSGYSASDIVRLEVPKGVVKTNTSAMKTESGFTALQTVVFPEGFTTLGGYTFKATSTIPSALVYVTLPSTLNSIGEYAFTTCASLKELIIPEGVTKIPTSMAYYCTALETLVLPSTIESIGNSAFRSCDLSNGVVIPEGCTSIGEYAFKGSNTPSVYLPSTLETVSKEAFKECPSLTTLTSKSPIIGEYMFNDCFNLEFVTLENTQVIGQRAFNMTSPNIAKISELVLPEGLTSIGTYAFPRLSITELVTPSTLTTVGSNAFSYCKSLKKVTVLGPTIGSQMFADGGNTLEELIITAKLTSVGSGAFNNVRKDKFTTYFAGTEEEAISFKTNFGSVTDRFTKSAYCSYKDYVDGNYTPNSSNYLFIYDCNVCDVAFDGNHPAEKDDGDCTTAVMCRVCKVNVSKPAMEHVNGESLAYTDLMAEGEYFFGCTNEGCLVGSTTKAEALFTNLGYSAEIDGNGIVREFFVNVEAIKEYKRLVDNTFEYGMVVAIGKTAPLKIDEDGDIAVDGSGALTVNFTNNEYSKIKVKINNISDEAANTLIINTVYVSLDNTIYYAKVDGLMSTIAEGKTFNDLKGDE